MRSLETTRTIKTFPAFSRRDMLTSKNSDRQRHYLPFGDIHWTDLLNLFSQFSVLQTAHGFGGRWENGAFLV